MNSFFSLFRRPAAPAEERPKRALQSPDPCPKRQRIEPIRLEIVIKPDAERIQELERLLVVSETIVKVQRGELERLRAIKCSE